MMERKKRVLSLRRSHAKELVPGEFFLLWAIFASYVTREKCKQCQGLVLKRMIMGSEKKK